MRKDIIACPIEETPTPNLDAFEPLVTYLRSGTLPHEDLAFPKGTLRVDGRLDLCKQDTGVEGCRAVLSALAHTNAVRALLLGTNGIGDEGAAMVADTLRAAELGTVYLGCNLIGPHGAASLAHALTGDARVRSLWLKRNPIGPDGAVSLARMLRENRTLRTLDLVNTNIGASGVLEIARTLMASESAVEHLYLGGNALTADVAPILADLVRFGRLRGLYLNVNHLGDDGARLIAEAVPGSSLEALGLASNGLSDAGVTRVLEGAHDLVDVDLGFSPSTRVLGARGNTLGASGARAAVALLEGNARLQRLTLPLEAYAPSEFDALTRAALAHPTLTNVKFGRSLPSALAAHLASRADASSSGHEDARAIRSVYR